MQNRLLAEHVHCNWVCMVGREAKKGERKSKNETGQNVTEAPQYYLPAHPSSLRPRQFHYDANSYTFLLPAHTHLIGDLRVGVIIGLLRCNGQHGRVGLLGTLIILIRIVLIVPRQRRHIWHPAKVYKFIDGLLLVCSYLITKCIHNVCTNFCSLYSLASYQYACALGLSFQSLWYAS